MAYCPPCYEMCVKDHASRIICGLVDWLTIPAREFSLIRQIVY